MSEAAADLTVTPRSPGVDSGGILLVMLSLPRRLLALAGLLALLLLACVTLYLALELRNPWWLLGAVVAFAVLIIVWVRTIVALRRAVRRRGDVGGRG